MSTSKPEIIIIAAVSRNNVIGVEGKIPWQIREDMEHFREMTVHHPVVMGRVTYESIPRRFRPLAERHNLVLTGDTSFHEPGVQVARSLEDAIDVLQERSVFREGIDYSKVFIGGGQKVYETAMAYATSLEITRVDQHVEGINMRYFPKIDPWQWKLHKVELRVGHSFVTYQKR